MHFIDIVNNLKPIFYHFLDGHITETSGNTLINTLEFITENNINYGVKIICDVNQLINKINELKTKISEFTDYINNTLVYIGNDNHTTSILFFIKNQKLYASLFNSGTGIELHKYINNLYVPYKIIKLCDNIYNDDLLESCNKLILILSITLIYNYFINKSYKNNISDNIISYLELLRSISDYDNIFFYNKRPCNITDILTILNNSSNQIKGQIDLINYYNFIFLVFNTIDNDIKFTDIKYISNIVFNNQNNINLNIWNKLIFHIYSDDLYIISQQSGSCTWFCIYWAILFNSIINDANINEIINNIISLFYDKLIDIFTVNNFKIELNHDYNSYLYMKKIYNKLIDIDIIKNNNILNNEIDFIYNNTFIFRDIIKITNNTEKIKNSFFPKIQININENIYNIIINNSTNISNEFLYECAFALIDIDFFTNDIIDDSFIEDEPNNLIKNIYMIYNSYIEIISKNSIPSNFEHYIQYACALFNNKCRKIDDNYDNLKIYILFLCRIELYIYLLYVLYNIKIDKHLQSIDVLRKYLEKFNILFKEDYKIEFNNENVIINQNFILNISLNKYSNIFSSSYNYKNIYEIIISEHFKGLLLDEPRLFYNYKDNIDFLIKYPEYLHKNLDNVDIYKYDSSLFIMLNIFDIIKIESNYNNFLEYYLNLWITYKRFHYKLTINHKYNELNKKTDKIYFFIEILHSLSLLFDYINLINIFVLNNKLITIYYELNDNKKFIDYIISNKQLILNNNIINLISNSNINNIIIDNYNVFIDDQLYNIYKIDKCPFAQIFNYDNNYYLIQANDNKIIYKIGKNYNIKFICDHNKKKIKINEIYFNNNKVIRYNDIYYLFKNIIPTNCFHLIYHQQQNDTYKITFLNFNFALKDELLYSNNLKSGIYTFTINHNTQFYLNDTYDNIIIWKKLCLDNQINKFNIIYINPYEINNNGYAFTLNSYNLFDFNKQDFLLNLHDIHYEKINLVKKTDTYIDIIQEYDHKIYKKFSKMILISSNIKIKLKIRININRFNKKIKLLSDEIKNYTFYQLLLEHYDILYKYLLYVKYINLLNKLYNIEGELFISTLKVNIELFNIKTKKFNYIFEALFELISGYELLDEQMEKYISIIHKYNEYNNSNDTYYDKHIDNTHSLFNIKYQKIKDQKGGVIYPLHHFMMGKGKSSVLSPLLILFFILKYKSDMYLIIPEHLINDTKNIILKYFIIYDVFIYKIFINNETIYDSTFNNLNSIYILSDSNIKERFLNGDFQNQNRKKIFLIDEFDSLLDPLQSNFNISYNKSKSITDILSFMINIVKSFNLDNLNESLSSFDNKSQLIILEIINIVNQLKNRLLIYNINWGIHPDKFYAIPYKTKDVPLLQSNFSSIIITIFLTLYYYYIIQHKNIDKYLLKFIINNNLLDLFNLYIPNHQLLYITPEYINNYSNIDIIDKLLYKIFNNVKITTSQYNSSFIDIINIDNIFKIGYSGTMNVLLPSLNDIHKFEDIEIDNDEKINIKYVIMNTNKIIIDNDLLTIDLLKNYDALIDVYGLYKDFINKDIAIKIYEIIRTQAPDLRRDVIFIDENNIKFVIINNKIEYYDENTYYINPFIYYSRSHIIGVDIKQDYYPTLKGLCIIGNNSLYSQVAQAIFRLRKLNIGQTVDFLLININKSENLLNLLCNNEKKSNELKLDYLYFQTLKSIIRKNKTKTSIIDDFKTFYNEDIKYYYIIKDNELLNDLLTNNKSDLFMNHYLHLFEENDILPYIHIYNKINNKNSILKLIYNVNSSNIIIEQQNEQELQKIQEQQIEQQYTQYTSIKLTKFHFIYKYFNITKLFDITYNISPNIYFLPSIWLNYNQINYLLNISGHGFIYYDKSLILIPGYMIPYYINEYPIYNIHLQLINHNINSSNDINDFKENILFKIISNENINDDLEKFQICLFISIVYNIFKKNEIYDINYSKIINKFINKWIFNNYIDKNYIILNNTEYNFNIKDMTGGNLKYKYILVNNHVSNNI